MRLDSNVKGHCDLVNRVLEPSASSRKAMHPRNPEYSEPAFRPGELLLRRNRTLQIAASASPTTTPTALTSLYHAMDLAEHNNETQRTESPIIDGYVKAMYSTENESKMDDPRATLVEGTEPWSRAVY